MPSRASRFTQVAKVPDIVHGTYAGYQRHRLYGIPQCDDCLTASREYGRATRLTRRYRIARRNAWAKTKTLAALREMAPDLVARLMAEAVDEWEQAHPIKETA